VTLPSDSSGYYFPSNTIANFRTKVAPLIEFETDKWEVGIVEISYPKGYKKRLLHNTICLDSMEIKFPIKLYENVHDLTANISRFLNHLKIKYWFILVTFKSHTPKSAVHELGA
jgi:hypothetical protein